MLASCPLCPVTHLTSFTIQTFKTAWMNLNHQIMELHDPQFSWVSRVLGEVFIYINYWMSQQITDKFIAFHISQRFTLKSICWVRKYPVSYCIALFSLNTVAEAQGPVMEHHLAWWGPSGVWRRWHSSLLSTLPCHYHWDTCHVRWSLTCWASRDDSVLLSPSGYLLMTTMNED